MDVDHVGSVPVGGSGSGASPGGVDAGQEESGVGQLYVDAVGTVPDNNAAEAREAWQREEARGWVPSSAAHVTLRAIDGPTVGNSWRKQMAKMPEARVPQRADRATTITVVRHGHEEGYVTRYKAERAKVDQPMSPPMPAPPMTQYVIRAPPFLEHDGFTPDPKDLVTNRYHRDKTGFLVDWHQQEFPRSPAGIRGTHYVRVPAWFKSAEVPFGATVELPVVHCYFRDHLKAHDPFAWNVFKSEWTVAAGVHVLEGVQRTGRAWLYSRTLRT